MNDQVVIMPVEKCFDEYVRGGLVMKKPKYEIKKELVDAFCEEMYQLMRFRLNVDDLRLAPPTPKNKMKVENVAKQTFKRWVKLCYICRQYRETRDLIQPEDLKWEEEDRDASEEADYNEDDMGDDGFPMREEDLV